MTSLYNNKGKFRQKSPTKRFLSILGLAMFAFYFILGVLIIFWDKFPLNIDPTYKNMFGILPDYGRIVLLDNKRLEKRLIVSHSLFE